MHRFLNKVVIPLVVLILGFYVLSFIVHRLAEREIGKMSARKKFENVEFAKSFLLWSYLVAKDYQKERKDYPRRIRALLDFASKKDKPYYRMNNVEGLYYTGYYNFQFFRVDKEHFYITATPKRIYQKARDLPFFAQCITEDGLLREDARKIDIRTYQDCRQGTL